MTRSSGTDTPASAREQEATSLRLAICAAIWVFKLVRVDHTTSV
jgi:hypothetical protein